MSTVIEATYDGKVLTPVSASDLKPNTRYRLQVEEAEAPAAPPTAWDVLEQMAGTLAKPADWAARHDSYLHPATAAGHLHLSQLAYFAVSSPACEQSL